MMRDQRPALVFWWMAWAMLAVILRLLSTGIPESGDGVMHHLIARHSWQHTRLFLDHWGKPLFTLFSSSFAQLGLWGMTLFNALCFVATCWAADVALKERSTLGRWLFAPLLLCMPVYGSMVFAGLTEVLFGTVALLAVIALYAQRYVLAMIIASLLPFARPEYVAVWPFLIGWVLWMRRWKALPWILFAHVIYAVAGTFEFGDPFWVFTRDPYTGAASVYGQGLLLHFTDHIQHIYGAPFMWALAVGISLALLQVVREREQRKAIGFFTFCGLLPAFAIMVVHSILWWKGLKGSLGLTRVLATGAPLGALFVCAMLVAPMRNWNMRKWPVFALTSVAGITYIGWAVSAFLAEQCLPMQGSPVERVAREVGETVAAIKGDYRRVVHAPPLVALFAGTDPFDTATVGHGNEVRPNDLLVWDAAFGPNEGGMPLDGLLKNPELDLVKVIVPEERWIVLGGNPMEYFLFAGRPSRSKVSCTSLVENGKWSSELREMRCDTVQCEGNDPGTLCLAENEYPLEFRHLEWDMTDLLYADVALTGNTNERLRVVMEQNTPTKRISYWAQDIGPGEFKLNFHVPPHGPEAIDKLFFINLDRKKVMISEFKFEVCTTRTVRP